MIIPYIRLNQLEIFRINDYIPVEVCGLSTARHTTNMMMKKKIVAILGKCICIISEMFIVSI